MSGFSVGGSSSAADSRGSARIRADSARIRPDPPDFRQHNFLADAAECPANVRRTPPDSARIRADPRGLRRELAELSAQKMSVRKKFQKISVRRGRPSATDVLPPRIRRGRFRRGHFRRGRSRDPPRTLPPRKVVAFSKSIAIKLSRDFIFSSFPARVAGCLTA